MEAKNSSPKQIFLEKLLKINQAIDKNLVNNEKNEVFTEEVLTQFHQKNDELKNEIRLGNLAFYIFGDVSSGKTTFLNGMMCELTSFKKDIFATDCDENTMGLFFVSQGEKIKVSPDLTDANGVLDWCSSGKVETLDTLRVFGSEFDLASVLKAWNDFALANRKKIKKLLKIKVEIPFNPSYCNEIGDISFIDTPGIDVMSQKTELLDIANKKLSIFVWVLSLVNPKPLRENLKNFMRSLVENKSGAEFQFWIIITHEDEFIRKYEDEEDSREKVSDFKKKIITITEELMDLNINVSKITFLRANEYKLKKGEFTKLKYKELGKEIVKFKTEQYDLYRGAYFIQKLQTLFNEIKAKKGRERFFLFYFVSWLILFKRTFRSDELNEARAIFEKNFHIFQKDLTDFILNVKGDLDFGGTLYKEIKDAQSYLVNNSNYLVKKSYLIDMINKVIPVMTSYINSRLSKLAHKVFQEIYQQIHNRFGIRIDEFFGIRLNITSEDHNKMITGIFSLLMTGVGGGISSVFANSLLFISGYGLILGGILGAISSKNYIGMWTYDGCTNEIKDDVINFMEKYLKEARKKSLEEFEIVEQRFTEQMENDRRSEDSNEKEVDQEINACKEAIMLQYKHELGDTLVFNKGRLNFTERNIQEVTDPDLKAHLCEYMTSSKEK